MAESQAPAASVPDAAAQMASLQRLADRARRVSELSARHLPEPVADVVATPLQHDTPAEVAQTRARDWITGEVPAVPGTTMPGLRVVRRD